MKFIKTLFSIGSALGLGGSWKIVANVVGFILIAGLLWLGLNTAWNQATYANKHYKKQGQELASAKEELKHTEETLIATRQNLDSLNRNLDSIKKAKTADSLMLKGLIEQGQGLIKILNTKNKEQAGTLEKYRRDGRVCYELKKVKTGLFKTREVLMEVDCPKDSITMSN